MQQSSSNSTSSLSESLELRESLQNMQLSLLNGFQPISQAEKEIYNAITAIVYLNKKDELIDLEKTARADLIKEEASERVQQLEGRDAIVTLMEEEQREKNKICYDFLKVRILIGQDELTSRCVEQIKEQQKQYVDILEKRCFLVSCAQWVGKKRAVCFKNDEEVESDYQKVVHSCAQSCNSGSQNSVTSVYTRSLIRLINTFFHEEKTQEEYLTSNSPPYIKEKELRNLVEKNFKAEPNNVEVMSKFFIERTDEIRKLTIAEGLPCAIAKSIREYTKYPQEVTEEHLDLVISCIRDFEKSNSSENVTQNAASSSNDMGASDQLGEIDNQDYSESPNSTDLLFKQF